jgi:hypothetical protein
MIYYLSCHVSFSKKDLALTLLSSAVASFGPPSSEASNSIHY